MTVFWEICVVRSALGITTADASVTKITSRHSCHTEVLGTVQLWKSVVQVVKLNVD